MWLGGYGEVGLAVDGNLFGWTGLLDVPANIEKLSSKYNSFRFVNNKNDFRLIKKLFQFHELKEFCTDTQFTVLSNLNRTNQINCW